MRSVSRSQKTVCLLCRGAQAVSPARRSRAGSVSRRAAGQASDRTSVVYAIGGCNDPQSKSREISRDSGWSWVLVAVVVEGAGDKLGDSSAVDLRGCTTVELAEAKGRVNRSSGRSTVARERSGATSMGRHSRQVDVDHHGSAAQSESLAAGTPQPTTGPPQGGALRSPDGRSLSGPRCSIDASRHETPWSFLRPPW